MTLTSHVPDPSFDEYEQRFREHFIMERKHGVIEVQMHTGSREAIWSLELHRAIGQMFKTVGADRENELLILTGTGKSWINGVDAESFRAVDDDEDSFKRKHYQSWYSDGMNMVQSLIWDVDIPTIAAINGPGIHTEIALMCDLTLCTTDTKFIDPHLRIGLVPGDGQFLAFQTLLGIKRANYAMHTVQRINAELALEWGLVNEVLPREDLMPRTRELAAQIMTGDPFLRRVTTHLVKRPWRRILTDDIDLHFTSEMWAALVHREAH